MNEILEIKEHVTLSGVRNSWTFHCSPNLSHKLEEEIVSHITYFQLPDNELGQIFLFGNAVTAKAVLLKTNLHNWMCPGKIRKKITSLKTFNFHIWLALKEMYSLYACYKLNYFKGCNPDSIGF